MSDVKLKKIDNMANTYFRIGITQINFNYYKFFFSIKMKLTLTGLRQGPQTPHRPFKSSSTVDEFFPSALAN